jgi:hypothetical protein
MNDLFNTFDAKTIFEMGDMYITLTLDQNQRSIMSQKSMLH